MSDPFEHDLDINLSTEMILASRTRGLDAEQLKALAQYATRKAAALLFMSSTKEAREYFSVFASKVLPLEPTSSVLVTKPGEVHVKTLSGGTHDMDVAFKLGDVLHVDTVLLTSRSVIVHHNKYGAISLNMYACTHLRLKAFNNEIDAYREARRLTSGGVA